MNGLRCRLKVGSVEIEIGIMVDDWGEIKKVDEKKGVKKIDEIGNRNGEEK